MSFKVPNFAKHLTKFLINSWDRSIGGDLAPSLRVRTKNFEDQIFGLTFFKGKCPF